MLQQEKKRHHYVPVCYLARFTDEKGKIFAYQKDTPNRTLHLKPTEIAFEKYYYSQPKAHGGRDNNRFEDLFGTVETWWPEIASRAENGEPLNHLLEKIFEFVAMMRVRVPAMRDAVEIRLAEIVKRRAIQMDRDGMFPPKPEGVESILERSRVSIDPHQSIHAMPSLVLGMGAVLDRLGFEIATNETDEAFLTSDNPVVYFDPTVPEGSVRPYWADPDGNLLFFFPISSRAMLIGRSEWKEEFSSAGLGRRKIESLKAIRQINQMVARFGYRFLFLGNPIDKNRIEPHSSKSPILETTIIPQDDGEFISSEWVFGSRPKKARWPRSK